ncbi:hypothetical protein Syun_026141 [Stephania yunnanensis]|uniref:Uncharacterized protein n=1 Tax=Stephania yunnanensis TaxID=152371 RepID=A0AAP0ESY5_9MAGN
MQWRCRTDRRCELTNIDDAMEVRCISPNFNCNLHDLSNLTGTNGRQGLRML